jgi:hypothetical protein
MGIYRGRVSVADGKSRRFRLLLFADHPDRIHGEVLSAMGSTEMIVDGGGGRLAVTLPREGISYVGQAREEILERILGVRLNLQELVQGLLSGELNHEAYSVVREAGEGGLPSGIEFRSAESTLRLELKRLKPLRVDPRGLGKGEPPAGTRVRPLDELGADLNSSAEGGGGAGG